MFKKEEKAKFNPELPVSPKTKSFADEVFMQVPKPGKSPALDSSSIIASISENPNTSASFEDCDIDTWNEVYIALGKLKLHTRAKWDEISKVLRYR